MSPRPYLLGVLAVAATICLGSGAPMAAGSGIDQRALFQVVGKMYQIDPDLLAAIAEVESNGRSHALSPKGAKGMMQLMPATAKRFHVSDPYDPIDNVLGAARFLAFLRLRLRASAFDPSRFPEILAAYNAGEGAVESYCGIPPYTETREYIRKVLWVYLTGSVPPRTASINGSAHASPAVRPKAQVTDATLLEHLSRIRKARAQAELSQTATGAH